MKIITFFNQLKKHNGQVEDNILTIIYDHVKSI